MNAIRAITPLTWRVIAFVGLFVAISGIAGPRIIASDIFFRDGFGVYGSMGKACIFGLVSLFLLVHRRPPVTLAPWSRVQLVWLAASATSFIISWFAIDSLITGQPTLWHLLCAHAGLLMSVAFAGLACFGAHNLRILFGAYRREVIIAAGISVAFLVFLTMVYALWQPLSTVVMYS